MNLASTKDTHPRTGERVFNCVFAAILLATVAFFAITLIAGLVFNTAVYADSEGGLDGLGGAIAPYLWIAFGIVIIMVESEIYHNLKYFPIKKRPEKFFKKIEKTS